MLVSHKNRFIYTKTVKTAGTSVESYFEPFCMKKEDWRFSHGRREYNSEKGIVGVRSRSPLDIQGAIWWNHMPAKTIKALLGDDTWDSYFKFCVIRNPFEKMVSAFRSFGGNVPVQLPATDSSFEARNHSGTFQKIKRKFERWLVSVPLPLDQNKYMIDGVFCMDYVIRFEALSEGMAHVCKKLHIEYEKGKMAHLKKTTKPNVECRDYYSNRSLEIVERAYKWEIQEFGYSSP